MENLFAKGASLILQIIFVVALVLVFAWFDPFDIFVPSKNKLKNTPVQVQSIREIGQLITAEYYGEVISSLQEVINEKDYDTLQHFNTTVNDLHSDFVMAINDFTKENLSTNDRTKIYNAFEKEYPDIVENQLFENYLYYIHEEIKNDNYRVKESNEILSTRKKQLLIKRLYKNTMHWRDKLMTIQTDKFKKVKKTAVTEQSKNDYKKSRLVLIGRGWVKAGFDFRNFTNRNFRYDDKYHRIHFIGLQPQIISATINPWFIPEEGVEGFEFLIVERGAKLKPKYTNIVKQRCLDKLVKQANDKQILLRSKENAEQHLRNFFSLLLDNEVEGVYFHTNYLSYTLDVILEDSIITNDELFTIDSSIVYYYNNYDDDDKTEQIENFINELEKHKAYIYNNPVGLNNYSSLLLSVFYDRTIDSSDMQRVLRLRKLTLCDTLWNIRQFNKNYFNKTDTTARYQSDSAFNAVIMQNRAIFCNEAQKLKSAFEINSGIVLPGVCNSIQ
jgi:hypothetical protein